MNLSTLGQFEWEITLSVHFWDIGERRQTDKYWGMEHCICLPHPHLWSQILIFCLGFYFVFFSNIHWPSRPMKSSNFLLFLVCFVHAILLASTLSPSGISMNSSLFSLELLGGFSWSSFHSLSVFFLFSICDFLASFYLLLVYLMLTFLFASFSLLENKPWKDRAGSGLYTIVSLTPYLVGN